MIGSLFTTIFILAILLGIFSMVFVRRDFSIYLFITSMFILFVLLLSAPFISSLNKDSIQKCNTLNKDNIIVKDSFLIIYNNNKIKAFKIN